jgi:uncharacterized glyoxalase superfamily protein PhnB
MRVPHITPILNVSSLEESFAWFERFGWTRCRDWRDDPNGPPTFGAVGCGEFEIFLCQDGQGGRGRDGYEGRGVWMSFWVDDVDAVYDACRAAGLEVAMPPVDEPWGVREMHVRHPEGHMFRVSQSPEKESAE